MNENDLILDMWDDEQSSTTPSIDIDFWDESKDSKESNKEESKEEVKADEQNVQDKTTDLDSKEDEDDFDLDSIFADVDENLDDADKAIDALEKSSSGENKEEISSLRETINNLQQLVKKLSNDKADLMYKNAEISTFWSDDTDPNILMLSRNIGKAKEWDDKSKTKSISILKNMLYDLTGEDVDNNKVNKDIDMLSAMEQYNTSSNPNLKTNKKDDNEWFMSI